MGAFTPETRPIGLWDADADETRATTRKLLVVAEREGVTLIVHGRDPTQWPALKKAPDYYD